MKSFAVEILKLGYGQVVSSISKRARKHPLTKQVCYLMSFKNNNAHLLEALSGEWPMVIVYTKACQMEAQHWKKQGIRCYNLDSPLEFAAGIKHITQSQVVVADNYFACLSDLSFHKNQTVYQVWHATGAIKQFGLEDPQTLKRSKRDQQRFLRVYEQFDYIVVASEKMGEVFCRSYAKQPEHILPLGFFRTDLLLEKRDSSHPMGQGRRILYLPTYRLHQPLSEWFLDLNQLSEQLGEHDEIWVKLHPHMKVDTQVIPKVVWVASDVSADQLMLESDVLITDYSSTAFDFTLVHPERPLILYWPDQDIYQKTTGIQPDFQTDLSLPVCTTLEDVMNQLNITHEVNHATFNQVWNTYNDGQATARLVQEINQAMGGKR